MFLSLGIFILLVIYFMQYINFVLDKSQKITHTSQIHCFLFSCLFSLPAFYMKSFCFDLEIAFVIITTFIRMCIDLWAEFRYIAFTKKKSYLLFMITPLLISFIICLQKN